MFDGAEDPGKFRMIGESSVDFHEMIFVLNMCNVKWYGICG